jgi:D-arabinose 1-dehydrogenase-like Zn-dependent alcohol dehydrogenase
MVSKKIKLIPYLKSKNYRMLSTKRQKALDYVAKGKVKVMTETFPLEEISNAYDKVANGNVRFKAVIEPTK